MKERNYIKRRKRLIEEQKWRDTFLSSDGCCLICGETNPFVLVEHHYAGRRNSSETITLCADCHEIVTRIQKSWDKRWMKDDNPFEVMELFELRGTSDLFGLKAESLLSNCISTNPCGSVIGAMIGVILCIFLRIKSDTIQVEYNKKT